MASAVESLILSVETKNADKAARDLGKVATAAGTAGTQVEKAGASAKRTGSAFGRMRGPTSALTTTTGQLSVQLQDIAVQAQSGTDYLRIFAQQGPQIASIFGPAGAVFGAVIAFSALLAGPLIASIFNVGEGLDDLADKADKLDVALKDVAPLTFAEKIREARKASAEAAQNIEDFKNKIQEQKNEIILQSKAMADGQLQHFQYRGAVLQATKQIEDYTRELETENLVLLANEKLIARVTNQKSADENMTAKRASSQGDFIYGLIQEANQLGMTTYEQTLYKAELLGINDATMVTVDLLAQKIQKHEDEAKAQRESTKALNERLAAMADFRRMVEEEAKEIDKRNDQELRDGRERGESFRREVDEEVRAMEEAEEKKRQLRVLQWNLKKAEKQAEDAFNEEQRQKELERTQIYSGMALAIEDKLMKGKSEKQKAAYRLGANLLDLEKRERAKTIISTSFEAAMKAWAALAPIPIIGPALGAVAAGGIIAAGASYAAQSLQGRALGGQVRGGESYVVGERGPEVLTMGSNGRIIPNEKLSAPSQTNNQNVSVSFNITATDASGFDQLLQARRGMIIGMINQAMNNRGRKALV